MSTSNKVLWTLDEDFDPRSFERLCVDLLAREKYGHIVPVGGTKDHGRDAECMAWRGASERLTTTFFQFSLEDGWERKLRKDADKIVEYGHSIDHLVFVTSQRVTGMKRDALKKGFKERYGWELTVFDREWLRNRLEGSQSDLAKKYLGVDIPQTPYHVATTLATEGIDDNTAKSLFQHVSPAQVKAHLSDAVKANASDPELWKGLASVEYHLRQYGDALRAVNAALKLQPGDVNLRLLKGGILAEKGIRDRSRPLLLQARDLFVAIVLKLHRPVDHYNLANVLSPLGELDEAERYYRLCLKEKPDYAQAWKNLGSLLYQKGQHDEEMECYDKALQLRPDLVEAYLCKGTTLLNALDNPTEAIRCFEKAYELNPSLDETWNWVRYWFSRACCTAGQLERAVKEADTGLLNTPDSVHLLNQKASAMSKLWRQDESRRNDALEFFRFRARVLRNDYPALHEIVQILDKMGTPGDAWPVLDQHLDCQPYSFIQLCKRTGLTLKDVEAGLGASHIYRRFRSRYGFDDYLAVLHGYGLQPADTMLAALQHLLMVPFGIALLALRDVPPNMRDEHLHETFDTIFSHVARIFPVFGSKWVAQTKPATQDEQTLLLAKALACFSDVAVMEGSRQYGFIVGILHRDVDTCTFDGKEPLAQVCADIGPTLVANVAEEWGLVRFK